MIKGTSYHKMCVLCFSNFMQVPSNCAGNHVIRLQNSLIAYILMMNYRQLGPKQTRPTYKIGPCQLRPSYKTTRPKFIRQLGPYIFVHLHGMARACMPRNARACMFLALSLYTFPGGGGGTLIFSYICRLGSFFWVQNFQYQYFWGFSEK